METSAFPQSSLEFEKHNSQLRRQNNDRQSPCELGQARDVLEMTLPNAE